MTVILRTLVRMTGVNPASPYLSQMYWLPQTAGGSDADATDCLARFRAFWAALDDWITSTITANFDPAVQAIEDTTGELTAVYAATPVSALTMIGGTNPLPYQTQGLVRWATDGVLRGRVVKGRTFIPGPEEASNIGLGVPSSSYSDALTLAAAEITDPGVTDSTAVVWSRPTTPGGNNGTNSTITSGTGASSWSVQKSRR